MTKAFICAGQSNMAGGIVRDQLPESYLSWPNSMRCFGVDGPFNPVEHEKAGPEGIKSKKLSRTGLINRLSLSNTRSVAVI